MKKKQDKSSFHFGICGCIIILIWTGILIWAATQHYHFSKILEKGVTELLIDRAVSNTVAFDYMNTEDEETKLAKGLLSQTSTLSYVVKNIDTLPAEQGENMVKVVSYFSGNQSKKTYWSAVAGKKSTEMSLYQSSDKEVEKIKKEEQKENSKENTKTITVEGKSKTTDTSSNEKKKEENKMEQSITIFNNGSSDITSANQTDNSIKKEREHFEEVKSDSKEKLAQNLKMITKLKSSNSRSYLLKKFYITDSSTSIDNKIFQVNSLLNMNLKMKKNTKPQILILHTHGASESFIDSRKGKQEDSIIGVGSCLAKILSKRYGYQVIHDKTEYDKVNGKIDRNKAYNNAYIGIQKTLKKYPSIQVVIDLHRDGVGRKIKRTTVVDGKKTAQVMFFNGLSRNSSGNIAYLKNNNLQGNLAFSLQLKIAGMKHFNNLVRPVYLKGYRYNMHLRKRFTLIELGNEYNTVEEAKNAAAPIALMLNDVLSGKS